jgi:16S rRNA (uracil1498-N3)-methyltransferase
MDYFYTPPSNIAATQLTIEGDEFAHLTHVMRKTRGDRIRVVDGIGNTYDVVVESIEKRAAHCGIEMHYHYLHEPACSLTIAVGLLKNHSKFDFLVEKCTELGVSTIVPLLTERTIPQHSKTDRWQKIALAAMKQSERSILPKVHDAIPFEDFLVQPSSASLKLIPHEKVDSPTIAEAIGNVKLLSAIVCIGAEGGFSDEEVAAATRVGFQSATLGTRRLRTETAAIISCGLLLQ